ncbi:nucleotide-sugar transporter [Lichtheimia hyalospora FSU 10163]|nr:nucleotide-sugar transporter [Lichtheimia hyalospora FSU 10163]
MARAAASTNDVKYLVLLLLIVQNSALNLVMRYTRASVPSDQQYLASTAVFMNECVKLIVCFGALYTMTCRRSLSRLVKLLHYEFITQWPFAVKTAVPAVIYLIQNNLQYVAATHLDVATFAVLYQLKLLTTAFFSRIVLNKTLSQIKWVALGLLTIGIALVVLPKEELVESSSTNESIGNQSSVQGYAAVLVACVLSGLAAVYTEKILKGGPPSAQQRLPLDVGGDKKDHHDMSVWWINSTRLAAFSVVLGVATLIQDVPIIMEKGFFVHYTPMTWCVILIQAIGGLIVGLVVKFADSILKGFATSFSIILSSLLSVWLFGFTITGPFIIGTGCVIYATYLYGL